ncbi:hypothetical protein N8843_00425 [Verrucomicrobia bacterium]|nr:hypothetical protein [Verrucomicrobiota bacterium]
MIKITNHRITCLVLLSISCLLIGGLSAKGQGLQLLQSTNLFNRVQSGPGLSGLTDDKGSATDGQFKSVLFFGASAPLTKKDENENVVVVNIQTVDKSLKLGFVRIAAPFYGRSTSFKFGQVIPPPDTDESGVELTVAPSDYWVAEPFSQNSRYYFSPSTRQVFATQAGPVDITWRAKLPSAGDFSGNADYEDIGGNFYAKFKKGYVISGGAFKTPRKIYWTGQGDNGIPVEIPNDRLDNVKIVYNDSFLENVSVEEGVPLDTGLGVSSSGSTVTNAFTGTLWFNKTENTLKAQNLEGRVFMELLGTPNELTQIPEHLGYEIVDVVKSPVMETHAKIELGESLPILVTEPNNLELLPRVANLPEGDAFIHRHYASSKSQPTFYAKKKTINRNDVILWWMEEGEQGILWPKRFIRYNFDWPDDPAKYSHYIRPLVKNDAEAQTTAVELPTINVPTIVYQDALDQERGKLTPEFKYYTHLNEQHPAHRALLRFTAGDFVRFERVFSWLDNSLKKNQDKIDNAQNLDSGFSDSVATELTGWNPASSTIAFDRPDLTPRVLSQAVLVGQRIPAPNGELGANLEEEEYLSGHIKYKKSGSRPRGDLFSNTAYIDPLTAGFEQANQGAIIPVNAMPDDNELEVWWFRASDLAADQGFKNVYWPSVIGNYTVTWPQEGDARYREIILASNDGSGPLASLQAKGRIYFQNDQSKVGWNPNEEHALMLGGQAYALRDDLNITTLKDYSSDPFVLIEHTDTDGRPACTTYKVLREKDDTRFDFSVEAGTVLQAPMPLPLMAKPLVNRINGQPPVSLNEEVQPLFIKSSTIDDDSLTTLTSTKKNYFRGFSVLSLQDVQSNPRLNKWFFPVLVNYENDTLKGIVSADRPHLVLSSSRVPLNHHRWSYILKNNESLAVGKVVYTLLPEQRVHHKATVISVSGDPGNYTVILEFSHDYPVPATAQTADRLMVVSSDTIDFENWRLGLEPLPAHISDLEGAEKAASFTFQDRKGDLWVYRGPHDAADSNAALQLQYYYKTLEGFYFPSLSLLNQPAPGIITPYLRPGNNGIFNDVNFDPVQGDKDDDKIGDKNALAITYRPIWPSGAPILHMAETLALPKRGLPAVRGHQSLEILYQQSQIVNGGDLNRKSAVLHDPTREKVYLLNDRGGELKAIPSSVRTELYRGKTYFPNLPPHLSERFFFDATRGEKGALVLLGEFIDAPIGEDYFHLNVLSASDIDQLKGLVVDSDSDKAAWKSAIDNLNTTLELFVEDPTRPGTYAPSSGASVTVPPNGLAEITNDDIAVDSYALTATGPGVGYVTLVSGNGLAFQPEGEPVSLHILRVSETLHRGELKVVESPNPLSEKIGFQQVVDLAAKTDLYDYQWRISPPIDGLSPSVYRNTAINLLNSGETWNHLQYPMSSDRSGNTNIVAGRLASVPIGNLPVVGNIPFDSVTRNDLTLDFTYNGTSYLSEGNQVKLTKTDETSVLGVVSKVNPNGGFSVIIESGFSLKADDIESLSESITASQTASLVYKDLIISADAKYSEVWLSLDLNDNLHAKVYVNGALLVAVNSRTANDNPESAPPASIQALSRAYRISPDDLPTGTVQLAVELFSDARPGTLQLFDLKLDAFEAVDLTQEAGTAWLALDELKYADGIRAVLGGSADVSSLADNYLIMRYQAKNNDHASYVGDGNGGNKAWSLWTEPQLAEGWIKRVLKGINPFNQRVTDLFSNRVDTDASILTQAGQRWEGNVALNLDSINDFGLIEIYETVLNRGRDLSIDAGINYGPANDALLLAAGYLNDLYMIIGNESWADAANPTIGIGTKNKTYGDIATALFSFKGQLPNLLEEELALLRGRDDFLQPGVETAPVYNRLFWNYTRGIDSGEVIYALNYNITEDEDDAINGKIDADDARKMYPQGHGDAYGHYLTALKSYYKLLLDADFTWVPRTEAVLVLGKPVQVDYLDERKFAAAAAAKARAGKQIFDLSWRKDYQSGLEGWEHLEGTRENDSRQLPSTRYWGADHWANRTYQGAYFNWVTGNAMLPDEDPDPDHEGIQKVDRTTVPELKSLVTVAEDLQNSLDNAEAGLNPLGFPESALTFDINPSVVVSPGHQTHFEQVYERAVQSLNNAIVAFDDAKDVTRLMRSEEDELSDFRASVAQEELAYKHRLIELYGTPYTDDIGPGKTYKQGYDGPDLFHYAYIDTKLPNTGLYDDPKLTTVAFELDNDPYAIDYVNATFTEGIAMAKYPYDDDDDDFYGLTRPNPDANGPDNLNLRDPGGQNVVKFTLNSEGYAIKPESWKGRRRSPGKIQTAISNLMLAHNKLKSACEDHIASKDAIDSEYTIFLADHGRARTIREKMAGKMAADTVFDGIQTAFEIADEAGELVIDLANDMHLAAIESMPKSVVLGLASGGDLTSPARAAISAGNIIAEQGISAALFSKFGVQKALEVTNRELERWFEYGEIAPLERQHEVRNGLFSLDTNLGDLAAHWGRINEFIIEHEEAQRGLWAAIAEGDRIQSEREIFRQRSAAIVQGFRTRDAAFRLFRNEKLERYKTLFDLAAEYAFLAAKAYDYETGLLHTEEGHGFINRAISARALGVVNEGQPQFAGSNTGDPGLSSVLAEMKGDWDVLKGRLGFNNPDGQGTTVSLRSENFRILPGSDGADKWRDVLEGGRMDNLLADGDVRRYAMQIDSMEGLPVPGIVLEFGTTIEKGSNLFGRPLAGGDHNFSSALFATKIFAIGVALEGYQGMSNPLSNSSAINQAGGVSPADPSAPFLDASTLSATPEVFLIPVGLDTMRSPPLGDTSVLRTWNVSDVTIPLPFNIGASDFSSKPLWQGRDSLADELYSIRKHAPFRPVSTTAAFGNEVYGPGSLKLSQYTNNRLIGRSAWNTKWKLVIPGYALLNNPKEGLDRFIRTVNDIKLHFVTYSYAGN